MRTICCMIMGASLGHLIVKGLIDGDLDKWIYASIAFVTFLGYIGSLWYEETKDIK